MLLSNYFAIDAQQLAHALLAKIIWVRYSDNLWLKARIIETEAYYLAEKASHASLGFTPKRRALFMPAGTIYMYYARGGPSFNISALGDGNAVLIKSAYPYLVGADADNMLRVMQQLNPKGQATRSPQQLCKGQTLLCKSLNLDVLTWDQQQFHPERFFIQDANHTPQKIIQTTRLGIPPGRDGHLPYRFIDYDYANHCTQNPLRKKQWQLNKAYFILG